jgi:hypothetical protein
MPKEEILQSPKRDTVYPLKTLPFKKMQSSDEGRCISISRTIIGKKGAIEQIIKEREGKELIDDINNLNGSTHLSHHQHHLNLK